PTLGTSGACCACAAIGHATAPPSNLTNSRRLIVTPRFGTLQCLVYEFWHPSPFQINDPQQIDAAEGHYCCSVTSLASTPHRQPSLSARRGWCISIRPLTVS